MTDTSPDTSPDTSAGAAGDAPAGPVLVLNGSNRTGSFNRMLAGFVVDGLVGRGVEAELVDLHELGLPLFDADLEAAEGPPPAAHELRARIGAAPAVVIVSPEYNGAMTPLLKNTVDWVSRVDLATFFTTKVALLAASPGRRAGASVLDLTSRWLAYIGADLFPETFGLGSARHVLVDDQLAAEQAEQLAAFLDALAPWLTPAGPPSQTTST